MTGNVANYRNARDPGRSATTGGTMQDLPLFMETPAHNGTHTSKDAAADIRPHAHTLRAKVLVFVASRGAYGATAQEIEMALNMPGNTVRPRLVELREHGAIMQSANTRKTTSGRSAAIWRFVE